MKALCGKVLVCAALAVLATPAMADDSSLWTLCLANPEEIKSPTARTVYDSQCSAFLQSQFANSAINSQATQASTRQTQETNQVTLYNSILGLLKAPPTQIPAGTDMSAIAFASAQKDAELTYSAAKGVGQSLAASAALAESSKAILAPVPSDVATLLSSPVDASLVESQITAYMGKVADTVCSRLQVSKPAMAGVDDLMLAAAGISLVSTLSTALQPTVVATAKANGVSDPSQLLIAGVTDGLGDMQRSQLLVGLPTVTAKNRVVLALAKLQNQLSLADQSAKDKTCAKEAAVKSGQAVVADAKAFLATMTASNGTSPSVLDVALRKAELDVRKVVYALVLQRDVSSGGAVAIKPNWFEGTKVQMGATSSLTYRLVTIADGTVRLAGRQSASWSDECDLGEWTKSTRHCDPASAIVYEPALPNK